MQNPKIENSSQKSQIKAEIGRVDETRPQSAIQDSMRETQSIETEQTMNNYLALTSGLPKRGTRWARA